MTHPSSEHTREHTNRPTKAPERTNNASRDERPQAISVGPLGARRLIRLVARVLRAHAVDEHFAAPKLVQVMPIGPAIRGRDGRAWTMSDPAAVARNTELPMVLDWEHSTEIKAPKGEPAPAAGWITALKVVPPGDDLLKPGIWAQVVWTPSGRRSVASREYRGISPVFQVDAATNEVVRLRNAALTNNPNLRMSALSPRPRYR